MFFNAAQKFVCFKFIMSKNKKTVVSCKLKLQQECCYTKFLQNFCLGPVQVCQHACACNSTTKRRHQALSYFQRRNGAVWYRWTHLWPPDQCCKKVGMNRKNIWDEKTLPVYWCWERNNKFSECTVIAKQLIFELFWVWIFLSSLTQNVFIET